MNDTGKQEIGDPPNSASSIELFLEETLSITDEKPSPTMSTSKELQTTAKRQKVQSTAKEDAKKSSHQKKAAVNKKEEGPASCYVVHVAIRPGATRKRRGRFVFNSKEDLRRWMELEFSSPVSVLLYLSYGQDVLLQIVEGDSARAQDVDGATCHSEWLLSRIALNICGIPIQFRSVRSATSVDRSQPDTVREPRRQIIDGSSMPHHVQDKVGVDSCYEVCVNAKENVQRCLCSSAAGENPCGPTLFECVTMKPFEGGHRPSSVHDGENADDSPNKKALPSIAWECIGFDEEIPDLPSRPLRNDESLLLHCTDDDNGDEYVRLRVGWTDLENDSQTLRQWNGFLR
jgi:hypothetical protein